MRASDISPTTLVTSAREAKTLTPAAEIYIFQLSIIRVNMGGSRYMHVPYSPFNKPPLPGNSQINYHSYPDQKNRMKVAFPSFSSSLPNNPSRKRTQKLPVFLKDKSSTYATMFMFSSFLNRLMNLDGPASLGLLPSPVLCYCA